MKIYMVIGDNYETCEDHTQWIEAAFASRDLAEDYIKTQIEEHSRDIKRMFEIEVLEDIRKLTYDEYVEYLKLNLKWPYNRIDCHVTSFDVRE